MVTSSYSSIREEILRIDKANAAGNHWAVLGIPAGADYKLIKTVHRKWLRKLHPDRWFATADPQLYAEIQEAFYRIQVAYFEALKHCAVAQAGSADDGPITMPSPEPAAETHGFWTWVSKLFEKLAFLVDRRPAELENTSEKPT